MESEEQNSMTCVFDSCFNPKKAQNLCHKHYEWSRRHGFLKIKFREAHGGRGKPEYHVWSDTFQRCYNKKNKRYNDYGGRGIQVCERWRVFSAFMEDMGDRPNKFYSLDRINNDGDYEPSNCRWATRSQQMSNRRHWTVPGGYKRKIS